MNKFFHQIRQHLLQEKWFCRYMLCRIVKIVLVMTGSLSYSGCYIESNTNVEIVREYHEIWSSGEVNKLDKIIAPYFICDFIGGYEYRGIDGAKKAVLKTKNAFPDWKVEIVDVIENGNKVVTRYYATGTHLGSWDGIESTGKKVRIEEVSIYYLVNGKIIEQRGFWDEISLKNQMSVNP